MPQIAFLPGHVYRKQILLRICAGLRAKMPALHKIGHKTVIEREGHPNAWLKCIGGRGRRLASSRAALGREGGTEGFEWPGDDLALFICAALCEGGIACHRGGRPFNGACVLCTVSALIFF